MGHHRNVTRPGHATDSKAPKSVPFVELHGERAQGVVASSSSNRRVYVSYVEADTGDFYCRTNNNRRCGGLRSHGCKHIRKMLEEAVARYSGEAVREYLGLSDDEFRTSGREILNDLDGDEREAEDGEVFARFSRYVEDLDREGTAEPVPEMAWFVA